MKIDDKQYNFLLLNYQELNAHIRATDDKRDKILSIYVVFAATLIGVLLDFHDGDSSTILLKNEIIGIVSLLGLIVVGQVVINSMIGARKWHAEYMNCGIILQEMLLSKSTKVDLDKIKEKSEPFNGAFHTSRSFILTQLTIMINTVFMACFINFLKFGIYAYLFFFLISIFIVLVNKIRANKKLNAAEEKFWINPYKSWMLAGLYKN